jgi:hypothetical protein
MRNTVEKRSAREGLERLRTAYFDCLPWKVRIVVYISLMEPIGYAGSSDKSEPAHCVASASGTPSAYATSSHTETPRARSWRCPDESAVR